MTVRFSNQLVAELIQPFWAAWQGGEFLTDASALAGTHRHRGLVWLRAAGGVRPRRGRDLQGRYLSFAEREEIAVGRAAGETVRGIANALGRSASTVSRELRRNGDTQVGYRASIAHARAYERASRPKPAKLVTNVVLRARVEQDLRHRYRPAGATAPAPARTSTGHRSGRRVPSRGCPGQRPREPPARRWVSNADAGHPRPHPRRDAPIRTLGN